MIVGVYPDPLRQLPSRLRHLRELVVHRVFRVLEAAAVSMSSGGMQLIACVHFMTMHYLQRVLAEYSPSSEAFLSCALYTYYFYIRRSAECMKWGMSDFHKTEPLRPEYYSSSTVQRVRSPITGRPDLFESPIAVRARLAVTSTIVGTLLGSVVVAVGCLFILRVLLVDKDQEHAGFIPVGWPDYITSILNGLQIQIFNIIYSWLATKLCAWENHPTQSSHDRSLTIKLALFYSINSYFSLLYIGLYSIAISYR